MELIGYEELRARQRELRAQGRYLGIGFSPFVEQGAWAGAIAAANGFPDFKYLDAVSVAMEPDGTVTLTTGLQSNGQGHETTMAQLAADELGRRARGRQGRPGRHGRHGVRDRELRQPHGRDRQRRDHPRRRRRARQAARHRRPPVRGGARRPRARRRPHLRARLARRRASRSARSRRPPTGARGPTTWTRRSIATRSYDPPETYSNACIAVVVEVDAETGQVHIERIVAVEDCGTVLNPAVVEGQVIGAIAQGIGGVLYEQLPYDEDGNFLAGTLVGLPLPDRAGGAGDRGRPPRDAVAGDRGRLQGHGRGRPDRRPLGDRQRDLGRPRRAGGSHAAAALRRARARRRRTRLGPEVHPSARGVPGLTLRGRFRVV